MHATEQVHHVRGGWMRVHLTSLTHESRAVQPPLWPDAHQGSGRAAAGNEEVRLSPLVAWVGGAGECRELHYNTPGGRVE